MQNQLVSVSNATNTGTSVAAISATQCNSFPSLPDISRQADAHFIVGRIVLTQNTPRLYRKGRYSFFPDVNAVSSLLPGEELQHHGAFEGPLTEDEQTFPITSSGSMGLVPGATNVSHIGLDNGSEYETKNFAYALRLQDLPAEFAGQVRFEMFYEFVPNTSNQQEYESRLGVPVFPMHHHTQARSAVLTALDVRGPQMVLSRQNPKGYKMITE